MDVMVVTYVTRPSCLATRPALERQMEICCMLNGVEWLDPQKKWKTISSFPNTCRFKGTLPKTGEGGFSDLNCMSPRRR